MLDFKTELKNKLQFNFMRKESKIFTETQTDNGTDIATDNGTGSNLSCGRSCDMLGDVDECGKVCWRIAG
jgi:hypothetical protein